MSFEQYVQDRPISQAPALCDRSGELMVDKLFQFEDLHTKLDAFFEELGIPERLPRSGTLHSSKKKSGENYLTPSAIDLINQKAALDFELFGYEKRRP